VDLILDGFREAIGRVLALDPDLRSAAEASLVTSGSATALSIVTGIPVGAMLGLARFRGRGLLLTLANTGMGFPPVVIGLFVVVFLWRSGPLGQLEWFCTRQGMIVAQYILAVPTVVGLTAVAVQSIDPMLRLQLAGLGATRTQSMWIILRESRLLLLTAAMAGFGAVISEVGASLMVGCNLKGDTRLLTTAIIFDANQGEFGSAFALSFVLVAIIFAVNAVTTWAQQRPRPR
jgi:tungstate transport system permease protein